MKLKLELTNDLMCLAPTLSFVGELCRQRGLPDKENKQFQMALEEVLSNVVKYAFDRDEEAVFDLYVTETASYIEVRIRELGIPYIFDDTRTFDPAQIHSVEDAVSQKGLGSYIISRMADKLEYKYMGVEGKQTTLVKYIRDPQVTEYRAEPKPSANYSESDIEVHLFRDEEALPVARCLYTAYGYTYSKYSLYEPAYLREVSRQDDTIITTAVSTDGEVTAVLISKEDEHTRGIMEMGSLVVSPLFRGLHIADKIVARALEEISRAGRNGVFAECVSLHLASQRVSLKMGLNPCAVLLNYIPNSVTFKKFDNKLSARQTFVIHYKPLNGRVSRIYMPARHADKIERIYERIGVTYELLTAEGTLPAESAVSVRRDDTFGVSTVYCASVGVDMGAFLRRVVTLPEFSKTQTWCVYLRMTDPNLEYGVAEAEAADFIFTGVLPGSDEGDLLILQHITDVEWLRSEVLLADESADGWMLDFIGVRYNEINEKQ